VSQTKLDPAGLTAAAEALESELRRYEELAAELQQERLDSEKALRRAAQALVALRTSDERLGTHVGALVAAINAARDRQQAQASAVAGRAEEIGARSTRFAALLERFEALGGDAAELNHLVQQLAAHDKPTNGEAGGFAEVDTRLGRLADDAGTLAASAQDENFPELARRADSLRQQLLSARNKLRLLRASEA
jgi:hypothetical protein